MAQRTWADNLDFHPHLHLCITDGVFNERTGKVEMRLKRDQVRVFGDYSRQAGPRLDIFKGAIFLRS